MLKYPKLYKASQNAEIYNSKVRTELDQVSGSHNLIVGKISAVGRSVRPSGINLSFWETAHLPLP